MSALTAWEASKMQLQVDLPAEKYTRWVEKARLARFDPNAGRFFVQTDNEYAREWLESRLASTLIRSLAGICGRRVEVEFIGPAQG